MVAFFNLACDGTRVLFSLFQTSQQTRVIWYNSSDILFSLFGKKTMAQYIYSMHRVGKIVPPKKYILKNISLSFFPGAKIGVLGLNGLSCNGESRKKLQLITTTEHHTALNQSWSKNKRLLKQKRRRTSSAKVLPRRTACHLTSSWKYWKISTRRGGTNEPSRRVNGSDSRWT